VTDRVFHAQRFAAIARRLRHERELASRLVVMRRFIEAIHKEDQTTLFL
jgi:hypothetical protein